MKIRYCFLISLIIVTACKNNAASSTSEPEMSNDTSFSSNIINLENGLKDTLIPNEEFKKIAELLSKSNFPTKESQYISLALKKAYQCDKMEQEIYANADSLFGVKKNYLQKKYPDSTTQVSLQHAWQNEELLEANELVKNFQNFNNPVKLALQPSPGSIDYLSSVYFDVSNDALRTLAELYRNGGNPPIINGIRVYIGKETSTLNAKDYKLILVGIKDGVDVFYPITGGPLLSIQNYGQPCRPVCAGARLPF